jgi:hypothetical protein
MVCDSWAYEGALTDGLCLDGAAATLATEGCATQLAFSRRRQQGHWRTTESDWRPRLRPPGRPLSLCLPPLLSPFDYQQCHIHLVVCVLRCASACRCRTPSASASRQHLPLSFTAQARAVACQHELNHHCALGEKQFSHGCSPVSIIRSYRVVSNDPGDALPEATLLECSWLCSDVRAETDGSDSGSFSARRDRRDSQMNLSFIRWRTG